ncbi:phosphopantetheine-binding protein [Paenibacillus silvae]|uniref:phosphopantetheine-binding protein n=1 Tax=Paenibacillus silvae TaxID=1325358 RepID=UPI002004B6A5|nr:phosphopantetheine-binding protein [Paenibacillus silvae]MCK6076573.1 acyl carrier protein [Paenibacillus silvae]MCK6151000.1 acyl carrier protein [Paenibacillus silvae]MCK6269260.1 acyl carrier protein [Paenibacillus silvae]
MNTTTEIIVSDYIKLSTGIESLNPQVNIFETGTVTSLFAIQLMAFIENNFNITIDAEDLDMDNFRSVEQIVKFVLKKQKGGLK